MSKILQAWPSRSLGSPFPCKSFIFFYLHKFSGLRLYVSHKTIELFWLNAHMTKSRVVYWSHFVTAVIFLTNESSLCMPNAVMPLCLHSKEWVLMIAKQFCSMDQYFLFVQKVKTVPIILLLVLLLMTHFYSLWIIICIQCARNILMQVDARMKGI